MNIHEYQAKALLRQYRVTTPRGEVVYSSKAASRVAEELGGKRWVVVAPAAGSGTALLLARAAGPEQAARVGDQTGGRVFLFLDTDDFARDHTAMTAAGVRFVEGPRDEGYGRVAVFRGLPTAVGPLDLSRVVETSDVSLDSLPSYLRDRVAGSIHADSLAAARSQVQQLAGETAEPTPVPTFSPGPLPTFTLGPAPTLSVEPSPGSSG